MTALPGVGITVRLSRSGPKPGRGRKGPPAGGCGMVGQVLGAPLGPVDEMVPGGVAAAGRRAWQSTQPRYGSRRYVFSMRAAMSGPFQ